MRSKKRKYSLRFQKRRLPVAYDKVMEGKYTTLAREAFGLFLEKNNAYRSVFVKYGVVGICVRIRDKLSLFFTENTEAVDESTVENFLDIANYALMGAMISFFNIKEGGPCSHLYMVVKESVLGKRTLRCINCRDEISL